MVAVALDRIGEITIFAISCDPAKPALESDRATYGSSGGRSSSAPPTTSSTTISVSWQTLERKAGFVGQIMRADPNGPGALEPNDAEALSYGQVKGRRHPQAVHELGLRIAHRPGHISAVDRHGRADLGSRCGRPRTTLPGDRASARCTSFEQYLAAQPSDVTGPCGSPAAPQPASPRPQKDEVGAGDRLDVELAAADDR